MAYNAATIANFFLDKASQDGRALTPMQVIKLVYIAHGWHLGYKGEPLIDEQVQAWKYGPVISSLYNRLRHYGRGAVTAPLTDSLWSQKVSAEVAPATQPLLESVWKNYSPFSGTQLSAMTHLEGTPWWITWYDLHGKNEMNAPIANELIRRHYLEKIEAIRAQSEAATA